MKVENCVNEKKECAIFIPELDAKIDYIFIKEKEPVIVIGSNDKDLSYEVESDVANTLRENGKLLIVECQNLHYTKPKKVTLVKETLLYGVRVLRE